MGSGRTRFTISESILRRLPKGRREVTLSNLSWIFQNLPLSPLERDEMVELMRAVRKDRGEV